MCRPFIVGTTARVDDLYKFLYNKLSNGKGLTRDERPAAINCCATKEVCEHLVTRVTSGECSELHIERALENKFKKLVSVAKQKHIPTFKF